MKGGREANYHRKIRENGIVARLLSLEQQKDMTLCEKFGRLDRVP